MQALLDPAEASKDFGGQDSKSHMESIFNFSSG